MKKRTFEERLVAGLVAIGFVEDKTDKSKYRAFKRPGVKDKIFVGKYGALRKGECASRSYSLGDPANQTGSYRATLTAGDKSLDAKDGDASVQGHSDSAPMPSPSPDLPGASDGTGTLDTDPSPR